MRMDYCCFHQIANLNTCVFLFLLLFLQTTNVTIVFSVKFSFRIIFYLNVKKKWTIAVYTTNPSIVLKFQKKSYKYDNLHNLTSLTIIYF